MCTDRDYLAVGRPGEINEHRLLCIEMITRTRVYHPQPRIWVAGLIKKELARREVASGSAQLSVKFN